MSEKILFVDDEPNVLSALKRQFRKNFDVSTALGGVRALQLIASDGPFAVIVSDMQMPEMDGIRFFREAMKLAPDSVRVMLTGNADQQTAMDAVNEGCVFTFLTKPCPPEIMVNSVNAAIEQYRLITAERDLLEGTLNGSVKLLMDMLSMVNPEVFGRTMAIQEMARSLGKIAQLQDTWNLEMAAMLCNIACVTLPPETLTKTTSGELLSPDEKLVVKRLPETGRKLINNIPRLEQVAEIVYYQHKHFDGSGFPEDDRAGENIPRESRILKILNDLETLKGQGISPGETLEYMAGLEGVYDPLILTMVISLLDDDAAAEITLVEVTLNGLQPGHILVGDIETVDGTLLFAGGRRVTAAIIERLHNHHQINKIREPIQIMKDSPGADLTNEARVA